MHCLKILSFGPVYNFLLFGKGFRMRFVIAYIEGKGTNAGYQHFLLFSLCSQVHSRLKQNFDVISKTNLEMIHARQVCNISDKPSLAYISWFTYFVYCNIFLLFIVISVLISLTMLMIFDNAFFLYISKF